MNERVPERRRGEPHVEPTGPRSVASLEDSIMADEKQFLTDIQSTDADVRFAAWRRAGEMSPSVIPELGKLAASKDPGSPKRRVKR